MMGLPSDAVNHIFKELEQEAFLQPETNQDKTYREYIDCDESWPADLNAQHPIFYVFRWQFATHSLAFKKEVQI